MGIIFNLQIGKCQSWDMNVGVSEPLPPHNGTHSTHMVIGKGP